MDLIKKRIIDGYRFNDTDISELIKTYSNENLFELANDLRESFLGKKFSTCMILNAKSGNCPENCKWCSQSAFYNTDIDIYDFIDENKVLNHAQLASDKGVAMFSLVTSGRKLSSKKVKQASLIYSKAKKQFPRVGYCASMGLLEKPELQELYNSGVRRYHCNIETAPSFFHKLCDTHTQEQKLKTISWAREVGMDICSGGIIGMGESEEQRIEMALFLQKLKVKSIPINILIPIKGTPLENIQNLNDDEILRTFAIFRIVNPDADIRFAGGRVRIRHIQDKALKCGISASMVGDLLTTTGWDIDDDINHFKSLNYEL